MALDVKQVRISLYKARNLKQTLIEENKSEMSRNISEQ